MQKYDKWNRIYKEYESKTVTNLEISVIDIFENESWSSRLEI